MNLAHSLKWSFLAELASKAVTPVVFIVLARLLTPEDFGVMSAAVMVIAFSQIFWEAGMGKALIQRQTDVEDAANVAFWVNIALGCLIAGLLFWGAEPIAMTFFQDQRVTAVLQVMTLQILLGAFASVQTALLHKEMGFKKLFWVRLVTVAFPGLASIPLAWSGFGYWALVAGTLTGQVLQVVMLWRMSNWRPEWRFHLDVAKAMARFGAWVGMSGLLAWFYVWADSLIVGKYLGTHVLGIYRTGNQVSLLVFGMAFGPILPVLYSHLSRMNEDRGRLKAAIEKVIRIIILSAIPGAIILFGFSEQLGLVFFGQQWNGIGFVIGVMALTHGYSSVVGMNGEVYRAMGKPSYDTIVTATALIVYLVVYIYTVQIGFVVFVWARFLLAFGALLLHLFVLRSLLAVRILPVIGYMASVTGCTLFVVLAVKWLSYNSLAGVLPPLLVGAFVSTFILGLMIFIIERNGIINEVISLVKARRA